MVCLSMDSRRWGTREWGRGARGWDKDKDKDKGVLGWEGGRRWGVQALGGYTVLDLDLDLVLVRGRALGVRAGPGSSLLGRIGIR